jgi:hypothetical protein
VTIVLTIAAVWLLVMAGVVVLCRAAQRGDADARDMPRAVPADVVPLTIARRTVAQRTVARRSAG